MPTPFVSKQQRDQLAEATAGPVARIPEILWNLVRDRRGNEGPPFPEPLSSEWLNLWRRARSEVIEHLDVPERVVQLIDERLPALVEPFDDEILSIRLKPEQKITILLGAGASAPEPSGIPTVSDLLPELWRRAQKIGRDHIDRLAAWCEVRDIKNIEDLLTAAYVANFAATNPSITNLLDYFLWGGRGAREEPGMSIAQRAAFRARPPVDSASIALFQDTLQTLFGLLTSTMLPAKPNAGHQAIAQFARNHKRTSIVTTNYDGCIDEALRNAGLPVNMYVEDDIDESCELDLIKMHGSINWTYCDSCEDVRVFDLLKVKSAYEDDTHTFPVIGICKTCQGQRRPLLVPPMAFKFIMFPNLIRLWNTARERIEGSDYLLVVGYSFAEADTYISKIISRSLARNPRQAMIVADPNWELVPKLRKQFRRHFDNFDARRVLRATGSCDVVLPRILDSLSTAPAVSRSARNGEKSVASATLPRPRRGSRTPRTEPATGGG
jgi:NAD-dependent SIR2 family protein deacetylase